MDFKIPEQLRYPDLSVICLNRFSKFIVFLYMPLVLLVLLSPGFLLADNTTLWDSLRSGQAIAMMRHAIAPGTSDPAEFRLNDCNTQRNLSDQGREQAKRIGNRFREHAISSAKIYSSQWCRCLNTAKLLELGQPQELEVINSFFMQFERREPQTQALTDWIAMQNHDEPIILVSHQVNITALTGIYPVSGEVVFIQPSEDGGINVLGTIKTD